MQFIVPDSFDQFAFEYDIRRHFWTYIVSPQIVRAETKPVLEIERIELRNKGIDSKEYDY